MSGHRETNPYFVRFSEEQPPDEVPQLRQEPDPDRRRKPRRHKQYEYPQQMPIPHSPPHLHHTPTTPHVPPPQRQTQTPLHRHRPETDHYPIHPPQQPGRFPNPIQPPQHSTEPSPDEPTRPHRSSVRMPHHPPPPQHSTEPSPDEPTPYHRSRVRMPHGRKTGAHMWLIGALCAIFWVAVVLGGLVVLVVYLLFRPRSPKFDISAASLNAAYLDMGYLLNADMTLLANFTNPSKKATVDFSYMYVNLYFEHTLISTTYVDPFKEMKAVSAFRTVHLVTSQVGLPLRERQKMMQEIEGNRIRFEVKASLRTRSNLGRLFRYSYWLFGHCLIEVTGPPSGVLVGKICTTKR